MPGMTKENFTEYIRNFDFGGLFIDLGWDHAETEGVISAGEDHYGYRIVAKLHGFFIVVISSAEKDVPLNSVRRQISTKLSKTFPEHLLIFHGEQTQYWSYRIQMENGKERYTETVFYSDKESDALYQRASGLFFQLDEYDCITFVDVKSRVRKGFTVNYDAVTKRFYDHFKKEHESFKKAIEGIPDATDLDWYTSVTLNRLMFCYFIQKKGFLDNDTNYLQNKLKLFIDQEDDTGFYSFYIDFLMVLFHDGLGGRERDEKKRELLGNIPYLNGGMFEVHELEQKYGSIRIHNSAFKEIFDFFDQYKWHLDINPDAPGNEINPDVLGYIFEKYINQRAEMGAYYTKEDITGYISKNTILPFLFDEVKRKYPDPFKESGEVWQFLKNSGDDYIYPAVKFGIPESALNTTDSKGLFDDLPEEIKAGLDPDQKDLWKIRKPWNKPAPAGIALPTEIYREVIERRKRYSELKSVIASGSIREINDLITYNLDIINFTEELLTDTQDPKLVEHFYRAVEKVTILDPTCGSGAFLFAAMNILEPVYEILIERMRSFVYDEDRINAEKYASRKGGFLFKYPRFREVLGKVSGLKDPDDPESGQNHPNQKYFIYKSIILNNLYGVDIMREAVEIAKLRLFLKLVAQVHPDPNEENLGIEPLPDMDFNLKTGNTLVGFGTKSEVDNLSSLLVDEKEREKIYTECEKISRIFENFKDAQLMHGETFALKQEIKQRIDELNNRLDLLLYTAHYGGGDYDKWHGSHQPFHWFAEFYGIFENLGGFDVVIGNPPYVEYSKVRDNYRISTQQYQTEKSGNLFAFVVEKSIYISNGLAKIGMILPLSAFCTDRMNELNKLMHSMCGSTYVSYYGFRPSKLFEGANRTIGIGLYDRVNKENRVDFATGYIKWASESRQFLFKSLVYHQIDHFVVPYQYPKVANSLEYSVLKKLYYSNGRINQYITKSKSPFCVYYRNVGGLYWKIITSFAPEFYENGVQSSSTRETHLYFQDERSFKRILALYNTNLFWFYYNATSDCWSLNPSDMYDLPVPTLINDDSIGVELEVLVNRLMKELLENASWAERIHKGKNHTKFQSFAPRKSKDLIDEIDAHFSKLYKFTSEELDTIISYDIKYRAGEIQDDTE